MAPRRPQRDVVTSNLATPPQMEYLCDLIEDFPPRLKALVEARATSKGLSKAKMSNLIDWVKQIRANSREES